MGERMLSSKVILEMDTDYGKKKYTGPERRKALSSCVDPAMDRRKKPGKRKKDNGKLG